MIVIEGIGNTDQREAQVSKIQKTHLKNLSEATPQEILNRIDYLDRKFNKTTSVDEARNIAQAISVLINAHKKALEVK